MEFADESKEKKDDRMKEEGRRKEESLANTRRERETHTHSSRGSYKERAAKGRRPSEPMKEVKQSRGFMLLIDRDRWMDGRG